MSERYGIAEWYGRGFLSLQPGERARLAGVALGNQAEGRPECPFQAGRPTCSKKGGVCGLRRYSNDGGRIERGSGGIVVTCPRRFEQDSVVLHWLADILGLDRSMVRIAREVPFMSNTQTGRPAGKIDFVVAETRHGLLRWHGLEIQAVYFSGLGMGKEFLTLANDLRQHPPFPQDVRRPDWRSSSAKRLLPQLQIKGPTLRRWGAKLAVCVDAQFFESVGGPSHEPTQDLDSGDIIWMVPEVVEKMRGSWRLQRGHWEVLTLEETEVKLQAARTVSRAEFEESLVGRLTDLPPGAVSASVPGTLTGPGYG